MNKYKVTIVIPVFNVAQYISKSLNSALNQTFKEIEYLIVNDHGSDNSMDIALEIIKNHPRNVDVRIINHIRNIGLGAVRNTGIHYAKGDFVFFMDSDDELQINAIEKLFNAICRENADVAIGSYSSVDHTHTGQKWQWIFNEQTIEGNKFEVAQFYLHGGFYVMAWNKLYNINFLRKNDIYCIEDNIHEDIYFTFQVAAYASKIIMLKDITYFYTFRHGSTMSLYKEKNYSDYLNSIEKIIQFHKRFKGTTIYSRMVYYIYGFRFSIMNKISESVAVSNEFKELYLKKFSRKILGINEIFTLKDTRTIHKIKYTISLFPYNIQLYLLKHATHIYENSFIL